MNPHLKGIVQDENRFQNYIQPNFGDKAPDELFPFEVDKLRVNLLKSKKPATVKNILEILRRLIQFAEKKHLQTSLNWFYNVLIILRIPKIGHIVIRF